MSEFLQLFFYLAAFHAFADFALQTDWMYAAKSHRTQTGAEKVEYGLPLWPLVLGSHALIHGGGVALLTGSILLGALEAVSHAVIDYLKSDEKFGVYTDQGLHIVCKAAWAVAALSSGLGAGTGT